MPWRTSSAMSQRHEFVMLASHEQANIRQLCGRFGIGPATAYKWLHRLPPLFRRCIANQQAAIYNELQ